ncbi:MAG: hypothetical protein ACOCWK_02860 [Tangfeifania sp.]
MYGGHGENLASSAEYHWFAGNFLKYTGPPTKEDLPVEAHHLVALCVPRFRCQRRTGSPDTPYSSTGFGSSEKRIEY